jgi:eukaryotic-like serine/threonine-protein kinase
VADFGLAMDPDETMTFVGGTPGYMAPEVVMGQKPTLTSDVWQLGMVLFEILNGERPAYERPSGQAGRYVARTNSQDPSVRELTEICGQCLADDPALRPASAMAVWQLMVNAQQRRNPSWLSRARARLPSGSRRTTPTPKPNEHATTPDAAP